MTTNMQSKALRLADALDAVNTNNADSLLMQMVARSAAAELRRLHRFEVSANEWIKKTEWVQETATCKELGYHRADVIKQRFDRLIAQRGELLEALKDYDDAFTGFDPSSKESRHRMRQAVIKARAAIAKAEGE